MGASLVGAAVLGAVVGVGFYTVNIEASGGSPAAKKNLRESSWAVALLSSAVALFASFMVPEGHSRPRGEGGLAGGGGASGGAARSRRGAGRPLPTGAGASDRYYRDEISVMMARADRGRPPF